MDTMDTELQTEKNKIKNFFDALNELIDGRFILSDVKVANVLKEIANSEILYNFFRKCLNNFDFRYEFKLAKVNNKINGGYFVLPEDEVKIIALVFCFLLEVDKQKINLQSFINDNFFSPDGYNISYSNFSITMLIPFKECVKTLLSVDESGNTIDNDNKEENSDIQMSFEAEVKRQKIDNNTKILFANLVVALNELSGAIGKDFKIRGEKKEELKIIIRAIKEAIKLENFVIINALMIPLEYTLNGNKVLKNYYNNVKECLISFYSEM